MAFKINIEKLKWEPHPIAKGVEIKVLLSKKTHSAEVTCMLVKIRKGLNIPEHIHSNSDDILFPLSGMATMKVEGGKAFVLKPGVFVRVPKGKKHKIYNVKKDLLLYDVFAPATI